MNHKEGNKMLYHLPICSENSFKFIFLMFITINLFIPSVTNNNSIILWENLNFINYFKAILAILSYAFLPGANIYKIIFPHNSLSKKFRIEPILIKLTFYPLISFSFLGVAILIFDQIGLIKKQMEILLFIAILLLFLMDIGSQIKKKSKIKLEIIKVGISKYSFIILLLALGILTVSIGFQIGWEYLVSGDPWDAIKNAKYIGDPNSSPIYNDKYPNFWGYVSYGLSLVGGLPFININSLIAPFSYLFITSAYIFMKSVFSNNDSKYAVLSTILLSLFSGFLIFPLISSLIFVNEFYFIYKSFSYFLFFCSLGLFFILITNKTKTRDTTKSLWKRAEIKILILGASFLVISFMNYMFPLIAGIILLFLFCLFSERVNKSANFTYFILYTLIAVILLLIFDIILNFYLSYIIIEWILAFFPYISTLDNAGYIIFRLLIYSLFFFFIFFVYLLNKVYCKYLVKEDKIGSKFKFDFHKILKLILVIFTLFMIFELVFIFLDEFFFSFKLSSEFFFFLFLDNIYLNLGFIGILGIYLSYYTYKMNKNLFFILISWVVISFITAFSLILIETIINFPSSPKNIPDRNHLLMTYWFDRIWFYSIPSLCIFTSIGLIKLLGKLKHHNFLNRMNFSKTLIKNTFSLILIFFSFSGIILTGVLYGNANFRYTKTQIKTLDWISDNIPFDSGVLVGDNFFMGVGADSITYVRHYFFYDIFEIDLNETKCIEQIEYLKNETIQYVIISQFFISYFLNKSSFTNNILIPNFYNITIYQSGDLSIHYAPYFD